MKRDIGIFLGYGPGLMTNREGISRLLLFLLRSEQFRDRVVFAMPNWSRKEFKRLTREFFDGSEIPLEIICQGRFRPFLFIIYEWLTKSFRNRKKSDSSKFNFRKALHWIKRNSIQLASRYFLLFGFPVFFFFILYRALCYSYREAKKFVRSKKSIINLLTSCKQTIEVYLHSIYFYTKEYELEKLVKQINRKSDCAVWFIPTGFWPQAHKIKTPKVIAFPDIVYQEFPLAFAREIQSILPSFQNIEKSLKIKAHFICYSEHVKQNHLSKPHQINENEISVIKHGVTDLSFYLPNGTDSAIEVLNQFQKKHLQTIPYLADFHFPSMKFLFYSSQARPHKNMLNLIKAFEILLRNRFLNLKLVLTANPKTVQINSYIKEKKLQNDILFFYDIPNDVLAALNHLAVCAVNPTLFEGGFPFTFTEAYSVGTPSVMSRIPVVLEEIQEDNLNCRMLFDPYRPEDMAEKITWAVQNRSELFSLQKPLFESFAARSWEKVVEEYLALFNAAAR